MPKRFDRTTVFAYFSLIFVILLWGVAPLITLRFYTYYSPTIRISFCAFVCGVFLLLISWRDLGQLNKRYYTTAIPMGFFMATANILQKIGLQYTTPTHYAFLENLSVLIVPVIMLVFFKKKPSWLTVFSAVLCLSGCFVLTGMTSDTGSASLTGDFLCALAGIFYGVNIAGTGAFAKTLYAPLYLMLQMFTEFTVSLVSALVFHCTGIEKILFTFSWQLILANVIVVFVTSTLCWLLRTNAMRYISPTVVAIMMPFSSVVTAVASILTGSDTLSPNLILGGTLGLVAIILSGFGDRPEKQTATQSKLHN